MVRHTEGELLVLSLLQRDETEEASALHARLESGDLRLSHKPKLVERFINLVIFLLVLTFATWFGAFLLGMMKSLLIWSWTRG